MSLNKQQIARRVGLAIIGAMKLSEFAKIDTTRIYVSGMSGGARIASFAAFAHPNLFSSVFAVCGINFCRKVPRVKRPKPMSTAIFPLTLGRPTKPNAASSLPSLQARKIFVMEIFSISIRAASCRMDTKSNFSMSPGWDMRFVLQKY